MKLNEEQLKDLYRQSAGPAAQPAACLREELLRRVAAREITAAERLQVVDHLRRCAECARNYRIAHATRQWAAEVAPLPGSGAGERQGRAAGQSWWRAVLQPLGGRTAGFAALALLVMIGSFIGWRMTRPGGAEIPVERGSANVKLVVTPPDKAVLEEVPAQLSWLKVESAESYQVTLYDSELTSLWESPQTGATSVQLPGEVRAKLRHGEMVYWRVVFLAGIERRQSDLFQFTLKAPANQTTGERGSDEAHLPSHR